MVGRQRAVDHGRGGGVGSLGAPATRRTTPSSSASAAPMPSTACSTPSARTVLPNSTRNRTSWPSAAGPLICWSAARSATQVTNALSGTSVGLKEYGTRLDFVPIVLGNGRMHIDVRARVSEPDAANSTDGIPSLTTREVETGVELRAGQTLAIAGLIATARVEASNHGLPWISEIPYLGVPFRSVSHQTNEVELIVLVTPEIVDGMEPGQVPACLPGMRDDRPQRLGTVLQRSSWKFPTAARTTGRVPELPPRRQPAGARSRARARLSRQNPQNRYRAEPDGHESAARGARFHRPRRLRRPKVDILRSYDAVPARAVTFWPRPHGSPTARCRTCLDSSHRPLSSRRDHRS